MPHLLSSRPFWSSMRLWVGTHKIWATIFTLVIIGGGWVIYGKMTSTSGQVRYVLGTVASSTIISSITASGQVTASDQIDVKAKVSGTITWVAVKAGDHVRAGQSIASIDHTDAKQTVREAEATLTTSKLQYQKDSAQAPLDFQTAQTNLEQANQDLDDAYTDAFNKLSQVYLDLPAVVTGTQNALYGFDLSQNKTQWNVDVLLNTFQNQDDRAKVQSFADIAKSNYQTARADYDTALAAYKATSRTSQHDTIDTILAQSTDMSTEVAQAAQSELNFLNTVTDTAQRQNIALPVFVSTLTTNLRSFLSTANTDQTSLLTAKKSLQTGKQTIQTDQHNVDLLKVGNTEGVNPISLQISANNIASAEANLANLKSKLLDYAVVSPFNGTVASVTAKVGDQSTGAIATIITQTQLAVLSMNEVDAAKIKVGQKATLTLDAIDGLTLTGKVAQVDSVGTVSQGVVSYNVKIAFDTFDDRVKTGMTVNASIITDTAQDVLAVPSSAVKTSNGQSYVQVFQPPLTDSGSTAGVISTQMPVNVPVTTGISDDTNVQILSDLTLGDQFVVRTLTGTATNAAATRTTTGTAAGGARGGTGGATFFRAL